MDVSMAGSEEWLCWSSPQLAAGYAGLYYASGLVYNCAFVTSAWATPL